MFRRLAHSAVQLLFYALPASAGVVNSGISVVGIGMALVLVRMARPSRQRK